MSPPLWAYQVENFNPPPDEELICSICQSVFCDPVQSPCNHVFCRNCILKWLESNRNCPICRKRTSRSTLQEVVPLIKNMIMKLTLYCHNSIEGCEEKFPLESCESHVKECPYEMIQCKNKPCKLMFMKKDLPEHERTSCPHSFTRCSMCKLKMPLQNPKTHNCIEELQKKLKEKTEKLKKSNQKIKKLKEKFKRLRDNDFPTSFSSSSDSLSPAEVLFSFTENSNLSITSLSSHISDSVDDDEEEDDDSYLFAIPSNQGFNFLSGTNEDSIEYPRAVPTLSFESSASVVDADIQLESSFEHAEGTSHESSRLFAPHSPDYAPPDFDEEQIRRPPKRRLTNRILDSSDEEEDDVDSAPRPLRKRTWNLSKEGNRDSAASSSAVGAAGPSYISSASTTESNSSTNDSSYSRNRNKFKLKSRLRSRSIETRSTCARTNSAANLQNNVNPAFERTISLLEQYNLESDPEWLPNTHIENLEDSDNELIFNLPGHITSSDESSIGDLDSDSSYEDAAEGRTEDLLYSFYPSSATESDDEWQPQ